MPMGDVFIAMAHHHITQFWESNPYITTLNQLTKAFVKAIDIYIYIDILKLTNAEMFV